MKSKVPKPDELQWKSKQIEKFWDFIVGDDLDFYEEYTIHLSDEEQQKFFDDNPVFMTEFPISRDKMYLLKDKSFRGILRKFRGMREEKKMALVKCPECGKE